MKKTRSVTEQQIALARVSAGRRLEQHRPKVEPDRKKYDRHKEKRRWQRDQEALFSCLATPLPCSPAWAEAV